jgi:flagellar motility protein MotE (MotC chaperone)
MKKSVIVVEIILLILILVKLASVFGLLNKTDISPDTSLAPAQAMAQQTADTKAAASSDVIPASIAAPPVVKKDKDPLDEDLTKQRDLAAALLAKKIELDNRENALRSEEQRLLTLRKEITEKITLLKGQQEKLTTILDANQAADIKRYKEMAKVYEAAPPAKAGAMMEKLDTKTAAGITMNMKKDKAGAVWGYISAQKAVEITKEITRAGKQFQE